MFHYIINSFFIFLFFLAIHKKWITIIFHYYIPYHVTLSLVRSSIERHCVWPMYAVLSRLYNPAFLSVFVVRFSLRSPSALYLHSTISLSAVPVRPFGWGPCVGLRCSSTSHTNLPTLNPPLVPPLDQNVSRVAACLLSVAFILSLE